MDWKTRKAILKKHYWVHIESMNDVWMAPHGNVFATNYLQELSDPDFEALIKKEVL